MSNDPLGRSSTLLAAPLDLYQSSLATLDIFDDVCHRPDVLSSITSSISGTLVEVLYPSCQSAWIMLLLHSNPHESLVPILQSIGKSFNEARRSAGGIAIQNGKKRAHFENDVVHRIDTANAMAYRIFFLLAGRLRGNAVLREQRVWRLCVEHLQSPDTIQCALAAASLLSVTDIVSTQARQFLSLIDEHLETIFSALSFHLCRVEQDKCNWYELKGRLDSAKALEVAAGNAFMVELLRASKKDCEGDLDIALEYYLKDDDRLRNSHIDKLKTEREVKLANSRLRSVENSLSAGFATIRTLCVFGAVWLKAMDVGNPQAPPGSDGQKKNRMRMEEIYLSLNWEMLFSHSLDEVSLCHGLSVARLLVIGAMRCSPYFQDRLGVQWGTEAIVELSYKGRHPPKNANDTHTAYPSDRNVRASTSGFYVGVPSRWYPAEEVNGWCKRAAEKEDLMNQRDTLTMRPLSLAARVTTAVCYWASYKNKHCRSVLLEVKTLRDGHCGIIAPATKIHGKKGNQNSSADPQADLCWINLLQYSGVKSELIEDSTDYYDSIISFHETAGLLKDPTERVLLGGILHHEDEPCLPYPDCTLECLNNSTTLASTLSRISRVAFSDQLEQSSEWSDAHRYSVQSVCSNALMTSRLLHASLFVKVHSYLIVSGAEGGAEQCSRRVLHPLDLVSSLLCEDTTGRAVAVLHEQYRSVLEPALKSWSQAAGKKGIGCDLLLRLSTLDILSVTLSGPRPTFRHPHAAEPMHAHLRTGPQLSSCVGFYRETSTNHCGDTTNENDRFGLYISLIDEACDTLYCPTPLLLPSLGCPTESGRSGEGGASVLCRSLRFLTAVASIDPVFVRRAMQRAAQRRDYAGSWAALDPDTPFLAPFYLILRGGLEALVDHLIRLEGEGGGGLFWRALIPRPTRQTATNEIAGSIDGPNIYIDVSYTHLRRWDYWQFVERESLETRRRCAELLSVLTMGDIGLCVALANAAKLCTGSLLSALSVRDVTLSQNIFRLSQNVLLSAVSLHGDERSSYLCPLLHPQSSKSGHQKSAQKPETSSGDCESCTKIKSPPSRLLITPPKRAHSSAHPITSTSKLIATPPANKIAMSPKGMTRGIPRIGWSDAFDVAVSVLPEEYHIGPAPRAVVDSAAVSLVHLPFGSPIHLFRLSLAQEGDFIYYAYRMIVEAAGMFSSRSTTIIDSVDTSPDIDEDGSLFGVDSGDMPDGADDICFDNRPVDVSNFVSNANEGIIKLHGTIHPCASCQCRWCRVDSREAENRRLDVLLFATEALTTFCAHRLELQQVVCDVAPDLYRYLLPLFPHPAERAADVMGDVLLDSRTVKFVDSGECVADFSMQKNFHQNPSLLLDQQIQSMMSMDSFLTDSSAIPQGLGTPPSVGGSQSQGSYGFRVPTLSPIIHCHTLPSNSRIKEDNTRIIALPLLRTHLGLCGACAVLTQALIHRHDAIRSAVRKSGCVGGLVRALDIATSTRDDANAILRKGSVESTNSGAPLKRKNAKSSDILDKFLAVKVINTIEVLIIRNVQAWEQIQSEAGVRGLLRLCLVGGSSIRVLAATALMKRISENPADNGSSRDSNTSQSAFDDISCTNSYNSSAARSEFAMHDGHSLFKSESPSHIAGVTGSSTYKSYSLSRATMISEVASTTYKGKILDDRIRGIDLRNIEAVAADTTEHDLISHLSTNSALGAASSVTASDMREEKRHKDAIIIQEAMRRRSFVDELISCGCMEAISSMLESNDPTSQTGGLRFLKMILMNSSIELREQVIDSYRPDETYFGTDRNHEDFVYMGSAADIFQTYKKFGTEAELTTTEPSTTTTCGMSAGRINQVPFFISIPRIGRFLYSTELDVVRSAADVLQVLASANPNEIRKILKYYQHIENKDVYSRQVPSFKLKILDTIKQKAVTSGKISGVNPYPTMRSFSIEDDNEEPSVRRRLPSMDLTSKSGHSARAAFAPPSIDNIAASDLNLRSLRSITDSLHAVDIPLASRVGYRLLDMANGRILPISLPAGLTSTEKSPLMASGLQETPNAELCNADNYFPHREEYLRDPLLVQELDHIARHAGILAGLLTDGEESNYTDGSAPLLETLGKSGLVSSYCEY